MELQEYYSEFQARNVGLMVVSTDSLQDAKKMADLVDVSYIVLADTGTDVASLYEVFNLLQDGVAAPATFIIGDDGKVLWRYVGVDISDRPTSQEILQRLDVALG